MSLPNNIILADGLRWVACSDCDDGTILILKEEDDPGCVLCDDNNLCPKHIN